MVKFASCSIVAYFLYSRLMAVEVVFGDSDVIGRDSFRFGAKFGERTAACIELESVGIDKIESTGFVWLGIGQYVADCCIGC